MEKINYATGKMLSMQNIIECLLNYAISDIQDCLKNDRYVWLHSYGCWNKYCVLSVHCNGYGKLLHISYHCLISHKDTLVNFINNYMFNSLTL